jgi:glycosyltransferase involved in cell wall biosynthesis
LSVEATTPRVSVVMANYNYGGYLAAAIESVLAQTVRDWELIVVDDGSTDDSLAVVEPYTADPRVRVLRVDHLGQPGAKNAGIAAACGDVIAFLDADDLWHPEKLGRQLALLESDADVGVVYSRRTLIDESGRDLPYAQPGLHRGDVLSTMFRNNFVCFSSAVVRRQVFEHVGLFDTNIDLAIDYDLWLRVARHYHFDYVDEPLVKYRVGHGNLSRRVGERLKTALLLMRRFLHGYGGEAHVDPDAVRRSLAETYCNMGFALRPYLSLQSATWFARALAQWPGSRPAWRGLVSCAIPPGLRRALRRGGNWDAAYCSPENDPRNV